MPEDKIRKVLKIAKEPISMETPIGDDEVSIKDLIDAADAAEGLKYDDEEVNPEAALLIDSPVKSDIKIATDSAPLEMVETTIQLKPQPRVRMSRGRSASPWAGGG